MAAAFQFQPLLPEARVASELRQCLQTLSDYFSQSQGKQAMALVQRIQTAYRHEGNRWYGPEYLTPWDEADKDRETDAIRAFRLAYWRENVKPFLEDKETMTALSSITLRLKEPRISTDRRDSVIPTLERARVFFDKHFADKPGQLQ